jgi:hypothetical protein
MTHPLPDLDVVSGLRQRFNADQPLTNDDIHQLFRLIDDLHQRFTTSSLIRLSPEDYAALGSVYNTLMVALRRAGLHLQRVTATDGLDLPWVWFYRWSGSTRQGPFGTLDAAIGSAILQVRSGVLHKKL